MLESLFKKVTGLKACNFIKQRLQHRCFSVDIVKYYEQLFYGAAMVATSEIYQIWQFVCFLLSETHNGLQFPVFFFFFSFFFFFQPYPEYRGIRSKKSYLQTIEQLIQFRYSGLIFLRTSRSEGEFSRGYYLHVDIK